MTILSTAIVAAAALLLGVGVGFGLARRMRRKPEPPAEAATPAVVPKPQPDDVELLQKFTQELQRSYKLSPNDKLKASIIEAQAALKLARLARRNLEGGEHV